MAPLLKENEGTNSNWNLVIQPAYEKILTYREKN